jgi:hypothetical protein
MKAITQVVGRLCLGTWKSLSGGRAAGSRMAALLLAAASLGAWSDSHAVPAFARQTNMPCQACHYQTFPALNSFGRAFKAGGFTMMMQTGLSGDDLSLPPVLNASLVTKIRYQKTNGATKSGTNQGELQFPDEGALLIGGRASEHVGFLLELATFGAADTGSGDVTGAADLGTGDVTGSADTGSGEFSLFASFKMPFVYQVGQANLSFIPFSTDSLGAAYGFELLNTGAVRNIRVGEERSAVSAMHFVGSGEHLLGSSAATGFAFVASGQQGFVNMTLWNPSHGSSANKKFAQYVRAVFTPRIGDWDAGFGVMSYTGKSQVDELSAERVTKAWAVDAQLQGMVGSLPLGVYASYAKAPAETGNIFNAEVNDKTAWAVSGQLGIVPNRASLLFGYRAGDNGKASAEEDNALMIGGTYQFAQNVQFQLNHVVYSGNKYDTTQANGDRRTTLMLFNAF